MSPSRRSFLKNSSLALIAGAVPVENSSLLHARASAAVEVTAASLPDRLEDVNILQGTDSTPDFSRGNTLPIAALPFGMAHWTLQSRERSPWMFNPSIRRIQGFRCTHQLSPWIADYGQAIFLPFSGKLDPDPGARAASYRAEDATLSPHCIRLNLVRYRAAATLIPTERCCLLQTSFKDVAAYGLLLEVPEDDAKMEADAAARTIRFTSTSNEGGVPAGFATYYVVRFSEPWTSFARATEKAGGKSGRTTAMVHFDHAAGQPMRAAIGTSFISFAQAEHNLDLEVGDRSLDELKSGAASTWKEHFKRIEIEGGTRTQHRIFNSCFYRALLFPRMWHEPDAAGQPHHMSPYTGKVTPGLMYADHGYWDVYRAWYPFMTLCFPERLAEILQAWVNAAKEGGWLPQFPCPGYRACMTGSLIDSVFGDAAAKGIHKSNAHGSAGFDLAGAYEGLKKHATTPGNPDQGYGRRGLEPYLKFGYAPAGLVDQAVAETTDQAYGDFCIAQVAKALGNHDDEALFLKRSENWKHLFDQQTRFFRGKTEQGAWLEPFDPVTWGDPYVEGAAWQHRFDAPHDMDGLIAAYGGRQNMIAALETMMSMEPVFNVGVYGREIHEMSEMAAVPFGQYDHGNQPVHHILYLFAAAGRPDLTQHWARRVMNELYSESQFAGDEDTGSMAAWYLMSALGLYPHCPGKAEYTLGSPLFDRATINVPGRPATTISAANSGPDRVYVSDVKVNGNQHTSVTVSHDALVNGARIEFKMSSTAARS